MTNIASLGVGSIPRWTNWEYDDAAARTGASGFTADDLGKIAKQLDNSTFWELTAVTPTWIQVSPDGGVQASISIGAEAANVIVASIQMQDSNNENVAGLFGLTILLSDNNSSPDLTLTAPDAQFESQEGNIFEYVAGKMIEVYTAPDGSLNIDISETGVATWYLWVKNPTGLFTVSDAITFA